MQTELHKYFWSQLIKYISLPIFMIALQTYFLNHTFQPHQAFFLPLALSELMVSILQCKCCPIYFLVSFVIAGSVPFRQTAEILATTLQDNKLS